MGYHIDLNSVRLDAYCEQLASAALLPSRKILQENIYRNFALLKSLEIDNLSELLKALGSKQKIQQVTEKTGIPEEYLTILVREIKSLLPKPSKLIDFPGIVREEVEKLTSLKIQNTKQLYEQALTKESRQHLIESTQITTKELMKLIGLSDLCRIRWVNHTFAYLLYESGYRTSHEVAQANYKELHQNLNAFNEQVGVFKGKLGIRDSQRCVWEAQKVAHEIELDH